MKMLEQIVSYFQNILNTEGFPPRWLCGSWTPFHGWLYIISDWMIWAAYTSIPFILIFFINKKKDIAFPKILWLFAAFIFACGTTHLLDGLMFWWPAYRLTGMIEVWTAIISWVTVFALIKIVPQVLRFKSPEDLEKEIEDRKNIEKVLRQSEERFRLLVECIQDYSILMLDLEGRIITWNIGAERLKGYTANEVIGKHFSTFYPADSVLRSFPDCELGLAKEQGQFQDEGWRVRKDGSQFWANVVITPIYAESGNELIGFSEITRDLTERRQYEQALYEAKEEALQASRMKSEFLANMSHEIRTPLNGIMGMTELTLGTELNKEQRYYLEMVQTSGQNLLTVINDILDFSKIESGKLELDPIPFQLDVLVSDTMQLFAQQLEKKPVELLYEIDPAVPNSLVADPVRLKQVLTNLVGNAVKFTEAGEIFLHIEVMSRLQEDVILHFKVIDTGIGIPAELKDKIFAPFTQADTSTTRRFGGTGLGLGISSKLIKMMGGQIWLENNSEQGSIFHFTVRLSPHDEVGAEMDPLAYKQLQGTRVLIVDDNRTNLKILEDVTLLWHMVPTVTTTAAEALELLKSAAASDTPYPLVLSDYGMPEIDGYELATQILAEPDLAQTKIIVLSSYRQPGDAARFRTLGIMHYLSKPTAQKDLLASILVALGDKQESSLEPRLVKSVETESMKNELPEAGSKGNVLLVEDNDINQALACRILEKAGYQVTVADNGRYALEKLAELDIDLILMDVHMPEMDGFETTKRIREQGKTLPIIAITANALKGDKEKCLEVGMNGYVSKPFNRDELLQVIAELWQK